VTTIDSRWVPGSVAAVSFAVGARRLHDSTHSALWLLLGLVPVGVLAIAIFMLLASTPTVNQYGFPNGT
jgi:uncharacterized membrane protein YhaH (DUF805 family)